MIDIINRFNDLKLSVDIFDPWVNDNHFENEYQIKVLKDLPKKRYNAIVLAVSHDVFKDIDINDLKSHEKSIVYDIKGFLDKKLTTSRL